MTAQLKPCPFCGHDAYSDNASMRVFGRRTGHEYAVACRYCEASAPGDDDKSLAIVAWNRRADAPELVALVACAKAVLAVDKEIGTRSTVHDMLRAALAAYEALK